MHTHAGACVCACVRACVHVCVYPPLNTASPGSSGALAVEMARGERESGLIQPWQYPSLVAMGSEPDTKQCGACVCSTTYFVMYTH